MRLRSTLLAATGLSLLITAPAMADTLTTTAAPPVTELDGIVVRALPLDQRGDEVISNVTVLAGDELVRRRQATLGETLQGIPGVNSDTFGAGASRPVIRGQTSPRVKVLTDGSELMDASAVSPDHAVAGEPLLLDGIEILRGPSALLYGGGAIGGAVNLLDRKIPTEIPANGVDGAIEFRGGTADGERTGVVGVTAGVGSFAIRLEALDRTSDDYDIPSYLRAHHDDHDDHDDDDHDDDDHDHEDEGPVTRVEGTFNDTRTLTLGASWIGARGYLGVAVTEQNSRYGLPGHNHEYEDCHPHGTSLHCGSHDDDDHDHDHDHDDEAAPWVELQNRRVDVRGELNDPFAGVERIRFRGGVTDYAHEEIEGGEVGTRFTNEGHDARVEVEHAPIAGLRGVVGVQTARSDFAAVGDEGFVPESITRTNALFVLEQYQWNDWRFEGAVRQEWQETEAVGRPDRDHDPLSLSGSAAWSPMPGWSVALTASRSQRAPNVQELYARGVHVATSTFELGNADLDVETANTLELTFRKTTGPTTFSVSAFRHDFNDYIYARTLDQVEDFRLIEYTQADAEFTGIDGEVRHRFSPNFSATVFGDYVRAEVDGGGNLPRIPAARLGARVDGGWNQLSGNLEYYRVFEQDRIADFETETPGYDMLNATLAYDLRAAGDGVQVYVRGTNLLDELALNHTSFIKDAAPLRGRNFVLGVRARF
ncbi:TonB-dependent receptor domain-containing protein [Brevundimonas sp.]|uniref:TonB-dependent receptor domain-containing protein n=1 Tax=Brevundimonas sp. TaxID=1871086 RepID=UPI003918BA81